MRLSDIAYRTILAVLVLFGSAFGQSWNWAGQIASFSTGGDGNNRVTGITVDQDENIYLVGDYGDSVMIGGTKLKGIPVGDDMYVAKINSAGTFAWARSFGSQLGSDQAIDITHDPDGNVYVCGSFSGTLVLDTIQLNSVNISTVALAKYNANGDVLWAHLVWNAIHGPGGLAWNDGHLYVAVDHSLAKYTADGDTVWMRTMPNYLTTPVEYNDVAVDKDGDVLVTGSFTGLATYGSDVLHASNFTDVDILIAKYDQDGNVLWARRAGAVSSPIQYDVGRALTTDASGDVYVVGKYIGKAFFESDSIQMGSASSGMFIAKYSGDGDKLWVRGGSGTTLSSSEAYDVQMLPNQDILVAADFNFKVTVLDTTFTLAGGSDVLMLQVSPSGTRRWGKRSDSFTAVCTGFGLAVNPAGTSAYVGGRFSSSVKFAATTMTAAGGASDGWIGKMTINALTPVREDPDAPLPQEIALAQNYPNPFNPSTTIEFKVDHTESVNLTVYNILGERVRRLVDGEFAAGSYATEWDGRDEANQPMPSGVYFFRLQAGTHIETHKMTLLK